MTINSQRASTSLTYNVPFLWVNAAMPRSPKAHPPSSQQSPVWLNAELLWLETTHRHWFRPLLGTEQKEVLLLSIHSLGVCTRYRTSGQFAGGCRSSRQAAENVGWTIQRVSCWVSSGLQHKTEYYSLHWEPLQRVMGWFTFHNITTFPHGDKTKVFVCLSSLWLTQLFGVRPTHGQHVKLRVEFDEQPRSPWTRGLFLNQDNNQKRIDRRSMRAHKRNLAAPGRWATALWITAVCKVKYRAVVESLCRWKFWDMPSEDIPFY